MLNMNRVKRSSSYKHGTIPFIQRYKQLSGQVFTVVDAPVHRDELLHTGLVLHAGVVQAGVEHDDSKV